MKLFYDDIGFRLKASLKAKKVIDKVIRSEERITGDLNFIFMNDEKLRKINIQFLNHDYFTDVITFDYNADNIVNGEVYISIDTVRANSINYKVSLNDEVIRVMIHGTLHLSGYDDKKEEDKERMRMMEDLWLEEFKRIRDEL
ncbi:MAG: rRNA maturation RNase YbeY [Bacteroidales bacterium]|nr:rRNA maturation RNase YbeY [Bacteroidales bacterium]